jgi:protein TonB
MSEVQDTRDQGEQEGDGPAKWLIPVVALLVVGALVFWGIKSFKGGSGERKPQQAKIALLPDTTPPPPPPPPPDKKPEPEVKEDKPQPQPEDAPKTLDKPPEDAPIKMEGATGDGPSAFSGGSVNKEYSGGEINTGGTGGGANKLQFAVFNGQLQRHVQSSLARNSKIKLGDYRVTIAIWVQPGGELRAELTSSTGDEQFDEALKQALAQLPPVANAPANPPQPIRLRITNRMTG